MSLNPEVPSYPEVTQIVLDPTRTGITLAEAEALFAASGLPETERASFLQQCGFAHAVITWCAGTYVPGPQLK